MTQVGGGLRQILMMECKSNLIRMQLNNRSRNCLGCSFINRFLLSEMITNEISIDVLKQFIDHRMHQSLIDQRR